MDILYSNILSPSTLRTLHGSDLTIPHAYQYKINIYIWLDRNYTIHLLIINNNTLAITLNTCMVNMN